MKKITVIEHTADIGIRAYGKDLKEAFANTAYGMFNLIANLAKVQEKEKFFLEVFARDKEDLLVAFLSELLYNYETKGILWKRFEIEKLTEKMLCGYIFGEKINHKRHSLAREIKAVTYHQLKVEPYKKGWKIEVIFDV